MITKDDRQALQVLAYVHEACSSPRPWCQGAYRRESSTVGLLAAQLSRVPAERRCLMGWVAFFTGDEVHFWNPRLVKVSLYTGIEMVLRNVLNDEYDLIDLAPEVFNDNHKRVEVVALIERAMLRLSKEIDRDDKAKMKLTIVTTGKAAEREQVAV